MKQSMLKSFIITMTAAGCVISAPSFAVDVEAAEALARRESCLKCHGIDKKKDGPAYKQVAAKYRDKPDAEEKLMKHLTSGRVVKLASGDEEEHRNIKNREEGEIRNLIQWILSQ
jgi:cytochrome c